MRRLGFVVAGVVLAGMGWAQVTERVSLGQGTEQANHASELSNPDRVVSSGGRFVAFMSVADNLVPGDTNATWDIFVRDRLNRTTERVSLATGGAQANGTSGGDGLTMTPDGRFVAFESRASNLAAGDTNGAPDIFVRDRLNGTTDRASVATGGGQANFACFGASISDDGRYVAFYSPATNLVPGDTNGASDVFVRDRWNGATERVSRAAGGAQGNADSFVASISGNGRFVVFASVASNLVAGDTNGAMDFFVHDRLNGTTERVSVATGGTQGNQAIAGGPASFSFDGRYVAFGSNATNLVPGDTNSLPDIFVRDRLNGTTERVSVATGGAQAQGSSNYSSISHDGRFVSFETGAQNLVSAPPGVHVLVRDRLNGTTELASVSMGGPPAPSYAAEIPCISPDGRYVAFRSYSRNLVPGDSNGDGDVFLHDRAAAGFTSTCDPGRDGVLACPCSNPPSGPGRGCDNASATGGASLWASGIAYLSIDSLVFRTSGENPAASSLLLQSSSAVPQGFPFGHGVRCAAEPLLRLYTKSASGGGITAPDLGAGDETVSARSAALGSPILPGEGRHYVVAYRDGAVLGGCQEAAWLSFTQGGRIVWWP